jgi:ABC-type branched-subunit amino acid transport system ATPase component/ABC-type branched-subunit amino acid transport system permease subunit
VYAFLRQGELLVPFPGLPRTVSVGGNWPFAAALLLALVVAALVGALLHLLVFQPLRTAPPLARAVAAIGVEVLLTGLLLERVGTTGVPVQGIFPSTILTLGDVRVPADRLWFAATVALVAAALAAAYRWTRFGLQTRAVADSLPGAEVSGIDPGRVALANWAISSAVAGLAGVLISPLVPLVPIAYTLFIVPALAAATAAGFKRLGAAVAAGLAIGMVQSELAYLRSVHEWLPSSGLPELVPLVLILLVLVVRGRPLPSRGAIVQQALARAPRPRRPLAAGGGGVLAAVLVLVALHGRWRAGFLMSLVLAVVALSLVVVTGYAGQVSLAQLSLAGAAGFVLGPLTTTWHLPLPIAPLLAAGVATVVGVLVGLPALRIRGLPLAVVTLALALAIEALWFRNTDLVPPGGRDIARPSLLGLDLGPGSGAAYPRLAHCFFVLAVLAAVAFGVARLRTSRLGAAMLAVRTDERAAAASGIGVVRVKVLAFALGSFLAGLGGTLLAYGQGNVTFDAFSVLVGLGLFAATYLAGITSVAGGLLAGLLASGGLVSVALDRWFHLGADWYAVVTGVGLILAVVLSPSGLVGPVHTWLARRRPAVAAPPRVAPTAASRPAPSETGPPALVVRGVSVTYGGLRALDDVSLSVPRGSIVGIIGPNGAGKSTFLDAVSGFVTAAGEVVLAGMRIDRLPPHRRAQAGLRRTFQGLQLWDDLTIGENVAVGARRAGESDAALAVIGLRTDERLAGELSHGERQLVSIARAAAGGPGLLLLDEPAAGLDTGESEALGERLERLRQLGWTIVLVDHDVELVFGLCDEVHVLHLGRRIASGTPEEIRADPAVTAAYLGGAS